MLPQPNFLELSEKATGPNSTREDNNNLFKAFLELEEWIFIMPQGMEEPRPFISTFDNKEWIFVFTDSEKALAFGKANNDSIKEGFLSKDGGILFLTMKRKEALDYIYELNKKEVIYGMQINFGLPGWFVPVTSMPKIIEYLKMEI